MTELKPGRFLKSGNRWYRIIYLDDPNTSAISAWDTSGNRVYLTVHGTPDVTDKVPAAFTPAALRRKAREHGEKIQELVRLQNALLELAERQERS